jgi:hypothetical protein
MENITTMPQAFPREFIEANSGCYRTSGELYQCSFMDGYGAVRLDAILDSEIPLEHKFWFVCNKLVSREQNQQIAITVAEMALPIFEKAYPEDTRVRACLEAVKKYLAGEIKEDELWGRRFYAIDAYHACGTVPLNNFRTACLIYPSIDASYAAEAEMEADTAGHAIHAAGAAAAAGLEQELLNFLKSICLTP